LELKKRNLESEDCSVCLLPLMTQENIPVVESSIEHLIKNPTLLVKKLKGEGEGLGEQAIDYENLFYHLQCFNAQFKQQDITV